MKTKIIIILSLAAALLGGWMLDCRCRKDLGSQPQKQAVVNTHFAKPTAKEIVISTSVNDSVENVPYGVLYTPGTVESRTLQDIPLHLNVYSQSFGGYALESNELIVDLDRAVAENLISTESPQNITIVSNDSEAKPLQIIKILHSENDKYYGVVQNKEELNVLSEHFLTPHRA